MGKENHMLLSVLVEGMLFSVQAEGRSKPVYEYYRKFLGAFLQFAYEQHWPEETDRITTLHIRQFLTWVGTRTVSFVDGKGCRRSIQARPSGAWPFFKCVRRLYNWRIEEPLVSTNQTSNIHFKLFIDNRRHAVIILGPRPNVRGKFLYRIWFPSTNRGLFMNQAERQKTEIGRW